MSEVLVETAAAAPHPGFRGDTADLLAFLSFAAAERYGSTHPLSGAARLLRKQHDVDTRPFWDFDAADAEDEEDRRELERIWQDGGPLTDLVNNAAGNFISRTEDLSARGFDAIADTVFRGTFQLTQAVGKRWIAGGRRGSVVSITVTWARNGGPFVVPSAMSKAAVQAMTMSLASEWAATASASTRSRPARFRPKA